MVGRSFGVSHCWCFCMRRGGRGGNRSTDNLNVSNTLLLLLLLKLLYSISILVVNTCGTLQPGSCVYVSPVNGCRYGLVLEDALHPG